MSEQNRFAEYWKKFLQWWNDLGAKCSQRWQNTKPRLQKAGQNVGQKVDEVKQKVGQWWSGIVTKCKSLRQGEKKQQQEKPPRNSQWWSDFKAKSAAFWQKLKPHLTSVGGIFAAIGMVLKKIVEWIWRLRKLIMAVPVVWVAVKLAMQNMERLPESVGLDIQSTGEFARMVSRETAVYGPLVITCFCLLLMFCSRKTLLPWIISIFTLVLPYLIWLTNYYV